MKKTHQTSASASTAMKPRRISRRGSALIAALLFTSGLGTLVLPAYLKLSQSALELSTRNFYRNAALGLAETGIEHAIWALNAVADGSANWDGWSIVGNDAKRTFTGFSYGGNISGTIETWILDYAAQTPQVVTVATIDLPGAETVRRQMHAQLEQSNIPATGGGIFAYGLLARTSITASGGCNFDSWISDPDGDPATPAIPYAPQVRLDNGAIACSNPVAGAIQLGSSDVFGTAAIGTADYSGLNMSWGGQVGPRKRNDWNEEDLKDLWAKDPPGWMVSLSTGALTTGFTANYEDITVPEELTPTLQPGFVLPRTEQVLKSNQWSSWYQNEYVSEDTIGEDGETTVVQMNSLSLSANADLYIHGDVTIILPTENATSLQIIQGASLQLADDATLTIYTAGNTVISGAGLVNAGAAKNLQFWGTSTNSQSITFQGSGEFSGVIYAPYADITLPGGTDLYGAVVGNNIVMSGSGSFHFDESLENITSWQSPGDVPVAGTKTAVLHVAEITPAEFDAYLGS